MTSSEPRNPTDFDHFVRFIVACLAFAFLCIALGSCNTTAKQCRKAEKHMADAIHLCPSIMLPQVKSDTIVRFTEPEANAGEVTYTQADMDFVIAECERYTKGLEINPDTIFSTQTLTQYVCNFQTITEATDKHLLKIWTEDGKVKHWINDLPQKVQVVTEYVYREIAASPCPPVSRVRSWAWLWSIPAFVMGLFLGLFFKGSFRHE